MAEKAHTGGLMNFNYNKGLNLKLGKDRKKRLEEGYEQYHERKLKEERRKRMIILAFILLVLLFFGILIWMQLK